MVLQGGKVATVDKDFSIQEAVATQGDRIVFVGSNKDIEKYIGAETRVIELNGKLAVPGMTDAHRHPFNLGKSGEEETFSVRGTKSWQEVIDRVAAKVKSIQPIPSSMRTDAAQSKKGSPAKNSLCYFRFDKESVSNPLLS